MNPKRSQLIFIFITVFIDLLGVGIVVPLLPYYVKLIEQADAGWLVDYRAVIVGALAASYSLFQFVFAPMLGALSDRFGRRPVLLLSLLGSGASYIVFGLADQLLPLGVGVVLAVLFLARIVDGVTGGNISIAQAYIADSTPPAERAKGLGLIGAAFGLGFMLGPVIGGLLGSISLSAPAFAAAALTLGNVLFGFFRLPESLPVEQRAPAITLSAINPAKRLSAVLSIESIRPLLIGSFLLNFAFAGLQNNFAVFTDTRFGFGPFENAMLFSFIGLMAVVMQGFLIRKLVPRFGEPRLAVTGLSLMTLGFALVAVVPESWMLFPALGVLSVGSGMATPSLTSMISRRSGAQQQGSVLGGVQALTSLTMIVGPLFAGYIFDAVGPAAPYISGALLIAAGTITIALHLRRPSGHGAPLEQPLSLTLESEQLAAH